MEKLEKNKSNEEDLKQVKKNLDCDEEFDGEFVDSG